MSSVGQRGYLGFRGGIRVELEELRSYFCDFGQDSIYNEYVILVGIEIWVGKQQQLDWFEKFRL